MSKKNEFINFVEKAIEAYPQEMSEDAKTYWEVFKAKTDKEKPMFTDNGKLVMKYMQEHIEDMPMGKARDIGEGLFISSRTVSGAMRKLVQDGFVERIGENPVVYALTDKGKAVNVDSE